MTQKTEFDLVVIGGGPGGYVAAIRAAQLGMQVALVEKAHLGGICLNWGCIPTKALLRAAEFRHNLDHLSEFGIEISGEVKVNLPQVVKRSRDVAARLSGGVAHLLKKNKVQVIDGMARLGGKQGVYRDILIEGACYSGNRCTCPSNSGHGGRWQAGADLSRGDGPRHHAKEPDCGGIRGDWH